MHFFVIHASKQHLGTGGGWQEEGDLLVEGDGNAQDSGPRGPVTPRDVAPLWGGSSLASVNLASLYGDCHDGEE